MLAEKNLPENPGLNSLVGHGRRRLAGKGLLSGLGWERSHRQRKSDACLQTDQLENFRVGICDIEAVEFREPVLGFHRHQTEEGC